MPELDALLHELDAIPGCAATKRRVRQLFVTFAGQRIYFARSALARPEQVRIARAMLATDMPKAEVARSLMERLQVSEATAYRRISAALSLRVASARDRAPQRLSR